MGDGSLIWVLPEELFSRLFHFTEAVLPRFLDASVTIQEALAVFIFE